MTIRALNKPEHFVIAAAVVMNATLHLIADYNAGYHGDEFLHIDAGRHLSSGYMDFPPVIGILAFIQNLFRSDSLIINHLFVHLATILITVYCGLITMRLGGKWLAVIVTLSCILFSPGFAVSHSLFLPVVFEQLMWVICLYYLVSFCNNPHDKYLILFGIFSAIGFLTKYSTLFLISGLFLAILILRNDLFKRKSLWIAALVFLVIISPNVLWQVRNGFPVFHHITTLYHTQLNHLSFSGEIKSLLFFLNPLNAVFWLSGLLLVPFIRKFHQYRLVNFTLLFAFGLLLFSKGKAYYYFPVILGVLPFGAIFAEQVLQERQWILKGYLGIVFVSGVFWLPKAIALFPLDEYIRLYHLNKRDDNRIPITFENFYSKEIWETVLKSVSETYNNLPP